MDLNVQDWKEFKIPSLFDVDAGIYHYSDEYEDGDTPYVSASDTNNGIGSYISLRPDFEGNKITTGKVGCTAYYQPDAFCATSDVNVLSPKFDMSAEIGMFISRIINFNENYKWAYGRQCRVGNTKAIIIKLPIQHNADGSPVIDADKTYSDEGYIPDWQFMEDYIKSLHSEPITTTRGAAESLSLGVDKWEEFKLSDIFEMQNGYFNNKPETIDSLPSDNPIKFLGATAENNGITDYCGVEAIQYSNKTGDKDNSLDGKLFDGNCISITNNGSVCHAYYQNEQFTSSHDQTICIPRFNLTPTMALFICTIINGERFKWSYGRKLHDLNKSKAITIKLPVQRDASENPVIDPEKKYSDKGYIPDWDFMERYIDSLPYSDKIA